MSTKILHVKNGFITAVSLPNETGVVPYGDLVEVPAESPLGVGDAFEVKTTVEAVEAPAKKTAKKDA